jgi:hypothetical protein
MESLEQKYKQETKKDPIVKCQENDFNVVKDYYSYEYVEWLKKEIFRLEEFVKSYMNDGK